MRKRIIIFLRFHPAILQAFWMLARLGLSVVGFFVPIKKKTILFAAYGGKQFDDSPKALYDEICRRPEFNDWTLIWAFVEPDKFDIPRGKKVRIDTPAFFGALLSSHVWISNSGMDRGIDLRKKGIVRVETWHGLPFKKIAGEENTMSLGGKRRPKRRIDSETIRCAQGEYDREIYARVFAASPDSFLLCDLPRNDILFKHTEQDVVRIRKELRIPDGKKVILYMPTYREFKVNEKGEVFLAPPMDLEKWRRQLGGEYVLLVRAHYGVAADMNIKDNDFVRDLSKYPVLNDLYIVADVLISDYSSAFVDYSIRGGAMFCFAYDLDEYTEKRGLYIDLQTTFPFPIDRDEDALIDHILQMDEEQCKACTEQFRKMFAPYAGGCASQCVIDEVERRLGIR